MPLGHGIAYSTLVVDRGGKLLRPFITPDGYWRLPVSSAEVDPRFLAMLVAYEDKRFHAHSGVDPRALARAAWQALANGRIVSGGSTLTMQVARLLEPRPQRSAEHAVGDDETERIELERLRLEPSKAITAGVGDMDTADRRGGRSDRLP